MFVEAAGASLKVVPADTENFQIDFEKLEVSIFDGKGGDRIVPLPQPTVKILKEWLEIRPQWKGNN